MLDFWHAQSSKLLFPEIEWSKPEQRTHAGKLLIIGGGAGSFHGLVNAHKTALKNGVGEVRVLLPDSLKKDIKIDSHELIFAKSNQSGGFSNQAWEDFKAGENGLIQFYLLATLIKIPKQPSSSKNSFSKAKNQILSLVTQLIFF